MAKTATAPDSPTEVIPPQATSNELALMQQFANDAGAGFEEADSSAYAIPFLQVLQSGSPQCKKSDGAYIKGAEEGKFYNTVTQELFDGATGLIVVPCHYTNRFNEWKLREEGGGFVAEHLPTDPIIGTTHKDEKGRDMLSNGHQLVDTRNHYVLIMDNEGNLQPALLSLSSTSSRTSRTWMSKMQGIKIKDATGKFVTAPMNSRKYKITTIPKSNDKGSWFVPDVALAGIVTDPGVYQAAADFRDAVRTGKAVAKPEQAAEDDMGKEAF